MGYEFGKKIEDGKPVVREFFWLPPLGIRAGVLRGAKELKEKPKFHKELFCETLYAFPGGFLCAITEAHVRPQQQASDSHLF